MELVSEQSRWVSSVHGHDSLLQNVVDEELNADEQRAAWEEYENDRRGIPNGQWQPHPASHSEARSSSHPSALCRPCLRPYEHVSARSVPSKPSTGAARGGFAGTERAGTRWDGRKQGRNGADGCCEDRALLDDGRV